MEVTRITPLQRCYREMKAEYLAHFQKRAFRGYRSPWLPVCGANYELIKRGDLIISSMGIEQPHLIGRNIIKMADGRLMEIEDRALDYSDPQFVWVDPRRQRISRYLDGNPKADEYRIYSEAVQAGLRSIHSERIQLISEVEFPLFHGTDIESAQNILASGIDIYRVVRRGAFFAAYSIEEAERLGNFSGAVVKFAGKTGVERPRWVYTNRLETYGSLSIIFETLGEMPLNDYSSYSWKTIVSELGASAHAYGIVQIFDDFEKYVPVEIINRSPRTP